MNADGHQRTHTWLSIGATALVALHVFIWTTTLLAFVVVVLAIPVVFSSNIHSSVATALTLAVAAVGGAAITFFVGRLVRQRFARAALVTVAVWFVVLLLLTVLGAPTPFLYTID
jgi:hypothetical protein